MRRAAVGKGWLRLGAGLLALLGAVALGNAGVIHAKAWLAPVLIAHSWHTADPGGTRTPWPWADARVAARLAAPSLGVERFVFDNDQPRTLAFGPGLAAAEAGRGVHVISGHRDTHFGFLEAIQPGMLLELESPGGHYSEFRVASVEVVDSRRGQLPLPVGPAGLVLVTCFPFDAVTPGGPLRFVVVAEADTPLTRFTTRPAIPANPEVYPL